jgi:hypothetical protein
MFTLNRWVILNPWLSWLGIQPNSFQFADTNSRQILANIPKDAGVMLVGAHPDRKDGHILAEIHRQAGQYPASTLISSEMVQKYGNYIHPCMIYLIKPIFSMLGLIPLNRGARNPQVKEYTTQSIADGKWNSMFPEGDVRIGPRVFPMQKGAVEMAMQAAIKSNFERPILLVPFAHAWSYRYPKKVESKLFKAISKLESKVLKERKGTLVDTCPSGRMSDRIMRVGNQIMDLKLKKYNLPKPSQWEQMDFYQRAQYLLQEGTTQLEQKYGIITQASRLEHNRLMKIRSAAREKLNSLPPEAQRESLEAFDDLECAQGLTYLSAFSPDDLKQYGDGQSLDPEMLACYVLRLSSLMGIKREQLGERVATVKVMAPIDMRDKARHYQSLPTQEAKDAYVIQLTKNLLQDPIQQEVNQVRSQTMCWKSLANAPTATII